MKIIIKIPKVPSFIIKILEKNSFDAYLVGGCVRDTLLNIKPNDWDITTNALPSQIIDCFKDYTVILTGLQHGTVSIFIDKITVEVTTYRIDGEYIDHRRPSNVVFTNSLSDDLSRRDFTINAMAYSPKKGLQDFFNGMGDLSSKTIKCVGNPQLRFNDDALRIFRGVRFASQLGFKIEDNTKDAMYNNLDKLDHVSSERIQQELNKAILGKSVSSAFMQYTEILTHIIPELKPTIGFQQNSKYHDQNVFEHILSTVENSPKDIIIRLTMLLHDIAKPSCYKQDKNGIGHFPNHEKASAIITNDVLSRLKYSNKIRQNVVELVTYHDLPIIPTEKIITKRLNLLGEKLLRQLLIVQQCDAMGKATKYKKIRLKEIGQALNILNKIIANKKCFSIKQLAINGQNLIDLGILEGPQIGYILNKLVELIIEGSIENQKPELLKQAENLVKIGFPYQD